MSIIEACARSGAVTLDLLLAMLLLIKGRDIPAARWAGLFVAGTAAVLIVYAVPFVTDRSPWLIALRILAFGNPAIFWVVTAALFDDEVSVSKIQAAAWLLLVGLGFWAVYGGHWSPTFRPANVASIICVALALVQIGVGHAGDLIDARRRLRVIFVITVAPFTTAIIVATILLQGGRDFPVVGLIEACGSLSLTFFFAVVLLTVKPGVMFETPAAVPVAEPVLVPQAAVAAERAADDPREAALLAALRHELEDKKAYREEALSLTALASRLGVPEYRVRRLINQRLGHRNFNTFLNGYRLDDAMASLADASQAQVPIVTIGLDAGFQSISSFNRAFKAQTGTTPTDYRRRHQSDTAG